MYGSASRHFEAYEAYPSYSSSGSGTPSGGEEHNDGTAETEADMDNASEEAYGLRLRGAESAYGPEEETNYAPEQTNSAHNRRGLSDRGGAASSSFKGARDLKEFAVGERDTDGGGEGWTEAEEGLRGWSASGFRSIRGYFDYTYVPEEDGVDGEGEEEEVAVLRASGYAKKLRDLRETYVLKAWYFFFIYFFVLFLLQIFVYKKQNFTACACSRLSVRVCVCLFVCLCVCVCVCVFVCVSLSLSRSLARSLALSHTTHTHRRLLRGLPELERSARVYAAMMDAFACTGRTAEARGLLDLAARYVCMYVFVRAGLCGRVRACAGVCGRVRACRFMSVHTRAHV
jgi:hypothetical protein